MNNQRLINIERMLEALCKKFKISVPTDKSILEQAYRKERIRIQNTLQTYAEVIAECLKRDGTIIVNTPISFENSIIYWKHGGFTDRIDSIPTGTYTFILDNESFRGIFKQGDSEYVVLNVTRLGYSFAKMCCNGDIKINSFSCYVNTALMTQVERLGLFIRASVGKKLELGHEWIDRILVRVKNVDAINEFVETKSFDALSCFWITVYQGDNDTMLLFLEKHGDSGKNNFASVPIEKGIRQLSDWLYLDAISIVGFTPYLELAS